MTGADDQPDWEERLKSLPAASGVYLFRDRAGQALYVGKAKSLRARVRSYFQQGSSDQRAFLPFLRRQVRALETVVTATEKEAAILENHLIKEHKPRYNIKLRDDKEYLSLRLEVEQPWPRLELVRRPKSDGARYFGPYHSATAARRTLAVVEKHFKLRTCSDREMKSRRRPCLEYQIQRCPAPCVLEVDREAYAAQVRAVTLFLRGRHDQLSSELEERMQAASQAMEFELAGTYRDQLAALASVRQAQRVEQVTDRDQDVIGLFRDGDAVEIALMAVRSGRVVDIGSLSHRRVAVPDDEVMASFLSQHYGEGGGGEAVIPDEILVPVLPDGAEGVSEWLTERRKTLSAARGERVGRCRLLSPTRGPRRGLLELSQKNAEHAFFERRKSQERVEASLELLQQKLRLPTLPRRIEAVDISHLGGQDTVGAVVALEDGAPDKSRYRTYHVESVAEGDDYAAMYQVLLRRFRRGKLAREQAESEADEGAAWDLPDLVVVDGGRGQLGVALTAARDLGLHGLSMVGLAKERETPLGGALVDRIYLPGQKNPIPLRSSTPELFLLALARDEAHRFSNRGREKLGTERRFASELEALPGIGPKIKKALLQRFGSIEAIHQATDEEILGVKTVSRRHLVALRSRLPGQDEPT